MGIRDLIVFCAVLGLTPVALLHPYVGVLLWTWLGIMNPHRLAYGAAYGFPFAQVVAAATLIGLVITTDERRWKPAPAVYALAAFVAWFTITTFFAMNPGDAWPAWQRAVKIQLLTFVALVVLRDRRHVELLVTVIALSIAYYGAKGGLFTLLHGGNYLVWGPAGSFIEDNNALALAQVVNIPLLYYLYTRAAKRWMRVALAVAMPLCAVSALGSHSRGAALAIIAMLVFLWIKSPSKLRLGLVVLVLGAGMLATLPEKWFDRMETIRTYDTDSSAMGRITAWKTAMGVAAARPFTGGGFEFHTQEAYARYGPEGAEEYSLAMHSIYFQVLGEQGFVGLGLFLLVWLFTWRSASRLVRAARAGPEHQWAATLADMVKVSLVGYLVGGTFLSLAYWDVPYYLMVALVVATDAVTRAAATANASSPAESARASGAPAGEAAR
jgi:probable O-glycosylation ligase (exosortase A-associated)